MMSFDVHVFNIERHRLRNIYVVSIMLV